jgi:hypothetical protein
MRSKKLERYRLSARRMLGTMKARSVLLALALLAGVAADHPYRPETDLIAIMNAAKGYQPDGFTLAEVRFGPRKDAAYVRYSMRKEARDVAIIVLTLKKTAKGWQVESCAR